ncbi:hypothetical protein BKE30_11165 [Alkanindiges hydrocarboniclasticus]|jgi:plasmid stability protein|uniref:Antitoxin FitA-like ribbon-helix-helix domain-containing protein n=1 Tax=Alkanindiges hydrocarboniclasticus TaxID=1907941 RepID=A0A1S8CSJ6_9GAMM|nr:Arc family DNA-binding protein [Alkanindiges hydrocarboniclasticus]ONG38721.1 hypothetical protein BKE30_11165 [Alkanindiges hydrocarboniclasticus]
MANLVIRNIEDSLKERLRVQAAHHGRSMEEELRCILRETLLKEAPVKKAFGSHLHARFTALASTALELPPRNTDLASGVDFLA